MTPTHIHKKHFFFKAFQTYTSIKPGVRQNSYGFVCFSHCQDVFLSDVCLLLTSLFPSLFVSSVRSSPNHCYGYSATVTCYLYVSMPPAVMVFCCPKFCIVRHDLCACCEPEGETGTDSLHKCWKNWETVLHPVACRSRNSGPSIYHKDTHKKQNECHRSERTTKHTIGWTERVLIQDRM